MAVIKCKMCGGDLNIEKNISVAECEYCGTQQTVPSADDEKKLTLFSRANRLRFACEFDKAAGIYESIVSDFPEEAEAYWGLVLCRYGIEYVDDPATGKKIPTCHRSSFECVMDNNDFEQACENADTIARKIYREEAKAIEELRCNIVEISGKEAPYDIFICYKETDESGNRTVDSVIAQDVYDALTEKGYRVFFSRITLEDKLGTEYEPYIFAALNSAKIMLVFGSDYENYNSVWVKNEWSRFLGLIAAGEKKVLIPCYKGIDAYDMPKEFSKLSAQDMGKVGAIQDLLRGVDKILGERITPAQEAVLVQQSVGAPSPENLIKRGNLSLEDGDWEKAKELFNQVLDADPENCAAYLGLSMAENHWATQDIFISNCTNKLLQNDKNLKRAKQYATAEIGELIQEAEANAQVLSKQETVEKEQRIAAISERRRSLAAVENVIAAGRIIDEHEHWCGQTIGLKVDGTIIAAGGRSIFSNVELKSDFSKWKNIVAVYSGDQLTVGLKSDGTVVSDATGSLGEALSRWQGIVSIAIGYGFIVGLKFNGTVDIAGVFAQQQSLVSEWTDIVAIAAGWNHTVGLKSDGTVVSVGENKFKQCDVNSWTDIVAICCGSAHTVGLRSDGTVITAGRFDEDAFAEWNNIVAISAGKDHTIGLKSDGTVVAKNLFISFKGECSVYPWHNIVAIACGDNYTLGVNANGSVLAVGENENRQCNVESWKLFDNIDTLVGGPTDLEVRKKALKEQDEKKRQAEAEEKRKALARKKNPIIAQLEAEKEMLEEKISDYLDGGMVKYVLMGKKADQWIARQHEIHLELEALYAESEE